MTVHHTAHRAIRFLTQRLGALQARRDFKAFDELEAQVKEVTANGTLLREHEILRLAMAQGYTPEATS